jgi:hypothetical protein
MSRLVFKVGDVFSIKGRGIVLVAAEPVAKHQCPGCRRGSRIELRRPGLPALRTEVDAVPISQDSLDIFIRRPSGLSKPDVPVGTEVWLVDEDEEQ